MTAADGRAVDFIIAATTDRADDIYGRGTARVNARLSKLYPSMVDGPLWRLYQQVLAAGEPGHLPDFRYEEKRAGVVADSLFDVSVHPTLGGLLVSWQRLDEDRRRSASNCSAASAGPSTTWQAVTASGPPACTGSSPATPRRGR